MGYTTRSRFFILPCGLFDALCFMGHGSGGLGLGLTVLGFDTYPGTLSLEFKIDSYFYQYSLCGFVLVVCFISCS